jgi:ParB-like chromosome segregation protein Spo0J
MIVHDKAEAHTPEVLPPLLDVETWPLTRLIPYARNTRKISQEAIDKVASSLVEFGWQQPIVVDEQDVILAGHTRLLAAQKLNYTEAPVHVARGLTKQQQKAYRLADNRTGREARDDFELLALELGELKDLNYDLSLTGFDSHEIEPLLAADWSPADILESDHVLEEGKPEMRFVALTPEQHQVFTQAVLAMRDDEHAPELSEGRCAELLAANYLASSQSYIQAQQEEEAEPVYAEEPSE